MRSSVKPRLLLLSRPGCHLCEELVDELNAAFPEAFELTEACVDDRADWQDRFGRRIPVLLAEDGAVVCETVFDPDRVKNSLTQRR